MIVLTGPLADPQMLRALGLGEGAAAVTLHGRLEGGAEAGITAGGWPVLVAADQPLAGVAVEWTPALRRYSAIMGLEPVTREGMTLLGVTLGAAAGVPFAPEAWPAGYVAALARTLLALDPARPAEGLRARLPRIADWVAAKWRAAQENPQEIGPPAAAPDDPRFEILDIAEPYAHYFTIEDVRLRHRRYAGGWSGVVERAVFVSGDAVVVLPWDPVRDRVMLIDQFRVAPALRGDKEPWLYEAIAGRIDRLETPQEAARREAREEAGVTLSHLVDGPHHYPSPGATAEMLYLYVGITDLPDGIEGLGGLDSEDEDIRSHLVPRAELSAMLRQGLIRNGPLLVLALWLEAEAAKIREEYTSG